MTITAPMLNNSTCFVQKLLQITSLNNLKLIIVKQKPLNNYFKPIFAHLQIENINAYFVHKFQLKL